MPEPTCAPDSDTVISLLSFGAVPNNADQHGLGGARTASVLSQKRSLVTHSWWLLPLSPLKPIARVHKPRSVRLGSPPRVPRFAPHPPLPSAQPSTHAKACQHQSNSAVVAKVSTPACRSSTRNGHRRGRRAPMGRASACVASTTSDARLPAVNPYTAKSADLPGFRG